MKKALRLSVAVAAAAVTVMAASAAFADDEEANASGQTGMTLPNAGGTKAAAAAGSSDHDGVVGRLAVGYMGRFQVPIYGVPAAGAAPAETFVNTPAIGVRYWVDQMIGIDAGLGLHMNGGSVTNDPGGVSTDDQGATAFLIHGGVPLSLASDGHFSFQIIPELNVGFSSSTYKQTGQNDIDLSGFLLDIGARAGAEIQFGFIGIPQLSLVGSVGLLYQMQSRKFEIKDNAGTAQKHSQWQLATTVNENPWDLFTGNITALYYF